MPQEISPVSATTTHTYYEHGELLTTTDARAVITARTLDAADRVTEETFGPVGTTDRAGETMPKPASLADFPRPVTFLKAGQRKIVILCLLAATMSSGCHKEQQPGGVYGSVNEAEASHGHRETCKPAFLPLPEDVVKVRIDPYLEIGASFILIGCDSDLRKIQPEQKAELEHYFEFVVKDNHYLLERKRLRSDFRRSMISKINSLLGSERVTDVFVYGIFSTEFGPG